MKNVFFLSICLLAFLVSRAQLSINPEAGINFANADWSLGNASIEPKSIIGFKAGAMVDIGIYKGFYLQPGAFYSVKGAKYESAILNANSEVKLNYIEVPVNLAYRYDFDKAGALFVAVGPYLGIGLNGKTKSTVFGISGEEDIKFGDASDEMKKLEYGMNFGLGYISPVGIYIRGQYGMGFTNLSQATNSTWKNRVWSVSLGYAFELNER